MALVQGSGWDSGWTISPSPRAARPPQKVFGPSKPALGDPYKSCWLLLAIVGPLNMWEECGSCGSCECQLTGYDGVFMYEDYDVRIVVRPLVDAS